MNKKKAVAKKKNTARNFVTVSARSYGNALRGIKIYFEGKRPSGLRDDGTFPLGKHLLQTFNARFGRFKWIITPDTSDIEVKYGITRIRTSIRLLKRMSQENWARSAEVKADIVRRYLANTFPSDFGTVAPRVYVPGSLAGMLDANIIPRLSPDDKQALSQFLPHFVANEPVGTVKMLNATAHIQSLKGLAQDFTVEIARNHAEAWWQTYIKANILLMQQGYIKALDKLNVAIGAMKFPDFCLITHDNYLDILEIKKPDTPLLRHDSGRDNYYFDAEMGRAIIQVENYIEQVVTKAADVRSYLMDNENINIKAVRPRGIILAGNTQNFTLQKQRDDFKLLSQGIKNVTVVTYDELLTRLNNYIGVLEEFSAAPAQTS